MTIDLPKNLRLIKLPQKVEFILFLIKEELKNRKFTNNLEKAGFDVSSCYSGLRSLVLSSIGFEERPDELYHWYNGLLDEYAQRFEFGDGEALHTQSFDLYVDLEIGRWEKQLTVDKGN